MKKTMLLIAIVASVYQAAALCADTEQPMIKLSPARVQSFGLTLNMRDAADPNAIPLDYVVSVATPSPGSTGYVTSFVKQEGTGKVERDALDDYQERTPGAPKFLAFLAKEPGDVTLTFKMQRPGQTVAEEKLVKFVIKPDTNS